jgi:hypothetical protein
MTIKDISEMFIPKQFSDELEIIEITPTSMSIDVKKVGTAETMTFFKSFVKACRKAGIEINLKTKL